MMNLLIIFSNSISVKLYLLDNRRVRCKNQIILLLCLKIGVFLFIDLKNKNTFGLIQQSGK